MATVSGFTALSRVLGFLRDILIARYLGTGRAADAFIAGFSFPNMFRRIFGEGAFNAAFVPLFAREMEEKGKQEAVRFANNAFSSMVACGRVGSTLICGSGGLAPGSSSVALTTMTLSITTPPPMTGPGSSCSSSAARTTAIKCWIKHSLSPPIVL